jgi:hypothetical protein
VLIAAKLGVECRSSQKTISIRGLSRSESTKVNTRRIVPKDVRMASSSTSRTERFTSSRRKLADAFPIGLGMPDLGNTHRFTIDGKEQIYMAYPHRFKQR